MSGLGSVTSIPSASGAASEPLWSVSSMLPEDPVALAEVLQPSGSIQALMPLEAPQPALESALQPVLENQPQPEHLQLDAPIAPEAFGIPVAPDATEPLWTTASMRIESDESLPLTSRDVMPGLSRLAIGHSSDSEPSTPNASSALDPQSPWVTDVQAFITGAFQTLLFVHAFSFCSV